MGPMFISAPGRAWRPTIGILRSAAGLGSLAGPSLMALLLGQRMNAPPAGLTSEGDRHRWQVELTPEIGADLHRIARRAKPCA